MSAATLHDIRAWDPDGRTRLAPSPTGALHLGNVRTFVINWVLARQRGWRIALRMDDLDGPRIKPHAASEVIELLRWLGLDWDEGPSYQTQRVDDYRRALAGLAEHGRIYPCRCTRKEIQAASLSAPHADVHEVRYPGTCRPPAGTRFPASALDDPECAWRFRVDDQDCYFVDAFAGPQNGNVHNSVGDFLVMAKGGIPSYQLAVVVDDAREGVNRIARGDDLLSSVARQLFLYEAMNLNPLPMYWHVPLVLGSDGRRLAKRHGDTRVASFRSQGISPGRLLAWLALGCGIADPPDSMTLAEWCDRFEIDSLPREPLVFQEGDDRWLQCVF